MQQVHKAVKARVVLVLRSTQNFELRALARNSARKGLMVLLWVQRSKLRSRFFTSPLFSSSSSLLGVMAACLGSELAETVRKSRVFVVGTGGIGCELVKNLVLTGFQDLVMVRTRGAGVDDKSTSHPSYCRSYSASMSKHTPHYLCRSLQHTHTQTLSLSHCMCWVSD